MKPQVNVRHLEKKNVHLKDQATVEEMELVDLDEVIHLNQPLFYDLEVQKMDEESILARGRLKMTIRCDCVRCLKSFDYLLELNDWAAHLPLAGEDKVPTVNDTVDLTPYIREDILLRLPQHPLCDPDCGGLLQKGVPREGSSRPGKLDEKSSAWGELNKLKFE